MPTDNNSKLNINVSIEDLQFPLQVKSPEEEKIYREAATLIQHRLQRLRAAYPSLPSEKYYYVMAMINIYVEAMKLVNKTDNTPYSEMMNDLEKEINELGV